MHDLFLLYLASSQIVLQFFMYRVKNLAHVCILGSWNDDGTRNLIITPTGLGLHVSLMCEFNDLLYLCLDK